MTTPTSGNEDQVPRDRAALSPQDALLVDAAKRALFDIARQADDPWIVVNQVASWCLDGARRLTFTDRHGYVWHSLDGGDLRSLEVGRLPLDQVRELYGPLRPVRLS